MTEQRIERRCFARRLRDMINRPAAVSFPYGERAVRRAQ